MCKDPATVPCGIHSCHAPRQLEFVCAVVATGLLAGVAGLSTTLLLRFVEHLTYHYTFGSLLSGITDSSPVRRAVGPMVGGALAGLGLVDGAAQTRRPADGQGCLGP